MLKLWITCPKANIYTEKGRGPRVDPWGAPQMVLAGLEKKLPTDMRKFTYVQLKTV